MRRAIWIETDEQSNKFKITPAETLSRKKVEEIMRSFPEGVDIRVYGWKEQVDQICELACPVNTDDKPACQSDLAECESQQPIEELELPQGEIDFERYGTRRIAIENRVILNEIIRRVNERTT